MEQDNKTPIPEDVPRDEQGRRLFDEYGEPIHYATKKQRAAALIAAILVILLTVAFAWSLATGAFLVL